MKCTVNTALQHDLCFFKELDIVLLLGFICDSEQELCNHHGWKCGRTNKRDVHVTPTGFTRFLLSSHGSKLKRGNMERIVQLEISFTISSQNSWEIYSKILYLQLTNSLKLLDLGSRKSCKVTYTLDLWKIMLIRKYLWPLAQGLRCPNCHWAYCWHHEVLFSMLQHLWLVLFWGFFFSLCYPI